MARQRNNHDEKACRAAREAIETAALALFARKGFDAASTREICAKAGVTKPVLYYYFGCKIHLYEELILRSFSELQEQLLQASRRGLSTREKLVEMIAALFSNARSRPERSRLAFHLMFAPPAYKVSVNFSDRWKPLETIVQRTVQSGIAAGEIQGDARQITAALLGAQTYYVIQFLVSGRPNLNRTLAAKLVELLLGRVQPARAPRRAVKSTRFGRRERSQPDYVDKGARSAPLRIS